MNTKHDIFISYRRDGGETIAHHLYMYFRDDGYNPFFDFESLRAGKFNEQIYDAIDECKFFLLILPSAALDRCVNDGDWVRLEIAHAIKQKKIIIPIMLRGFVWPAILPEDIADVRYCQGVEVTDRLLFEGLYNELSKLIDVHFDRKRNKHGRSKWTRQRNSQIITIIADGAVCVAAILFLLVLDVWLIGKYLGIEELIFSSGSAWLDAFFLQASFAEILLLWIVASSHDAQTHPKLLLNFSQQFFLFWVSIFQFHNICQYW